MTLSNILASLFERDLTRLKEELSQYSSENTIWEIDKNIANSAGNLTLHLIGNLNAYFGTEIGKTGYVRNRPLEFSDKNVPREALIQQIDDTILMVKSALTSLQTADFEKEYPVLVFAEKTTMGYFFTHLAAHLSYHLGQINYHRRFLDAGIGQKEA